VEQVRQCLTLDVEKLSSGNDHITNPRNSRFAAKNFDAAASPPPYLSCYRKMIRLDKQSGATLYSSGVYLLMDIGTSAKNHIINKQY
jgi:hypothetical protein